MQLIKKIKIHSSVQSIREYAFKGCTSLTKVDYQNDPCSDDKPIKKEEENKIIKYRLSAINWTICI